MIISILYLLSYTKSQVINLEDNIICQGIPCNIGDYSTNIYNYGIENFGDLSGQAFQLSFYVKLNTNSFTFLFSIMQGAVINMRIQAMRSAPQVIFLINGTSQVGGFIPNDWFQVMINNTDVRICSLVQCVRTSINLVVSSTSRFNFFLQTSSQSWVGLGYGITLYKGFSNLKPFVLQNMLQPEAIVDINVQEIQQHNLTIDYSQYEYIAKLGNQFDWDDKDPYLIQNSLQFNSSQFIYVKDPKLRETYSIEFRLKVSDIFSSNITLMNYTYFNKYQFLVNLNGKSSINVTINGRNISFSLISYQIIHVCIGVIHNLEENQKYFQLSFIQFSNSGVLQIIEPAMFTYHTSSSIFKAGNGELYIGSFSNQFSQDQFIQLFHIRLYLGFFFDDQRIINPYCQFFLNDRCIICITGYVLALDHSCQLSCHQTTLLTQFIESHNQCLRICNPICATCSLSATSICLQCNGIRIQPPNCICPAEYFEDGASPNCRKFFSEIQTQIGYIDSWCGADYDNFSPVVFDRPYRQIPSIALFYNGYRSVKNFQHFHIDILSLQMTGFTILTRCSGQADYYQVYWISSVGNYQFNPLSSEWYNNIANTNYTVPQPLFKNNVVFTTFLHMKDLNNFNNGTFSLQIEQITSTIYNVKSSAISLRLYKIQNNFIYHFFSSPNQIASINLNNIPKSIQTFTILNGQVSNQRISFLIKQKQRNTTNYQIYNPHQITGFKGIVLFLTQQCYDKVKSCDFYSSYITSCSQQYSFCSCSENGYYLNSTNDCDCIFIHIKECSSNCGTCLGLKTNCTSCNPKLFQIYVNNNCVCTGSKFLEVSTNICQTCDFRCLTCSGLLVNNCLTCYSDQSLTPQKECRCQSGYYFDRISLICKQCSVSQYVDLVDSICVNCIFSCSTCNGGDQCLTCPASRYLTSSKQCACQNGYYENNELDCPLCAPSCLTCSQLSSCTTCPSTRDLDILCICKQGYYESYQFECFQCSQNCIECIDNLNCINCINNLWTVKQGICVCKDGYYLDNQNCVICQFPCMYCESINKCTQCSNDKILQNDTCVCGYLRYINPLNNQQCICLDGYFEDNIQCSQCQVICKTCQNSQDCITCIDILQMNIDGKCICSDGYFTNTSTFMCQLCQLPCVNCLDTDLCTQCSNDLILVNFKCLCAYGTYMDANTICQSCNPSCLTCFGQGSNECSSCKQNTFLTQNNECFCKSGYFNDNHICQKCDQSCSECITQNECLSCSFNRELDQQNQCVCLSGYYESSDTFCRACDNQCKTCDYNTCLSCYSNQILINGKCVCGDGYYLQGQNCLSCDNGQGKFDQQCKIIDCQDGVWSPHEECDDGNQRIRDGCSNCKIDQQYRCINVIRQQSICYKCQQNCKQCTLENHLRCYQCEEGFFLNQNQCLECSQLCLTCQSTANNCIKCRIKQHIPDQKQHCQGCDFGYYLANDQCISLCGDGIKIDIEDCDDGNILSGDGCSQDCKIEQDYQCLTQNQPSQCNKFQELDLFVNKIQKLQNNSYLVQIKSTQLVLFNNIELQITFNQNNTEIFTYIASYQEYDNKLKLFELNCTINLKESIPLSKLTFIVKGNFYNHLNQPLKINTLDHSFENQFTLTEGEQKVTQTFSQLATYQIIGSLSIFGLKLLIMGSGQLSIMIRINNIIQFIKFIDIQLPANVIEFLLEIEGQNIVNQMDFMTIYNKINFLPKVEFQYIQPDEQFSKYEINANFISNMLPFALNVLAGYMLILYLQFQLSIINKYIKLACTNRNSISFRIMAKLQIYTHKILIGLRLQGLQQLFEASQYNICFFISLQLAVQSFNNLQDFINFSLVIGFSIFYAYQNQLRINNNNLVSKGNMIFNIVQVIDPTFYIFCIVFLNKFPLCQLIFIQISQIIMISLLRMPFKDRFINYQTIIEELLLIIIFKSFLIYIYFPFEIDYIFIGFIQMGLISLILTSNMCIQSYSMIWQLKQLYYKKQMKLQKQKQHFTLEQI